MSSADAVTLANQPQGCDGAEAGFNGALATGVTRSDSYDMEEDKSLDMECESLTSSTADVAPQVNRTNGIVVTPPLPKGCVPLIHQVAGHMYGKGSSKAGLLQDGMGAVLKPGQNACRGKRERMFYQNITRPDQSDPVYTGLRPLVPRFYGTFVAPEDPSLVYLKINDITTRFRKPCVMDIKIGCKSYEDGVPLRKVELAKEKYPNLAKIGFQILGMRVYHPATDEFECRDKFYGRSLQGDNVIEGFARYLNVVDSIRTDVIPEFLKQMRRVERWFVQQKQFHFYSSSLLFVYEGAVSLPSSPPVTAEAVTVAETESMNTAQPNFVSYSQLKKAGPKTKPPVTPDQSVPLDSNAFPDQDENPQDENGFVNRLPTYEESIAVKMGCMVGQKDGGFHNGAAAGGTFSNGGSAQPKLLDINGQLTVSQMRERQRSLSQSKAQADSPSDPSTIAEEPIASTDSNANKSQPIVEPAASTTPTSDEKESDSKLALVKMIDFTHVVDADGTDESYLFGLRNVIRYFEMMENVYCQK